MLLPKRRALLTKRKEASPPLLLPKGRHRWRRVAPLPTFPCPLEDPGPTWLHQDSTDCGMCPIVSLWCASQSFRSPPLAASHLPSSHMPPPGTFSLGEQDVKDEETQGPGRNTPTLFGDLLAPSSRIGGGRTQPACYPHPAPSSASTSCAECLQVVRCFQCLGAVLVASPIYICAFALVPM
jgi:hypothetical protein